MNGVTHPPLSNDVFYIVPEKCTECVGFHDQEACAAVCPVDVCIPNPDIPETEEVLIARAKELHPGRRVPAPTSRRASAPGNGAGGAGSDRACGGRSAPPPAAAGSPPPRQPLPPGAPKPAAAGGRAERPLSPPQATPPAARAARGEELSRRAVDDASTMPRRC